MSDRKPTLLDIPGVLNRIDPAEYEGLTLGFRATRPDLMSRNGFRWPWPGQWAEAATPKDECGIGYACPAWDGDGLSVALDWQGAASGGLPATTCLVVAYDRADVLGSDDHKVRVHRAKVLDIINLSRADLSRADLYGANLYRANLSRADLSGAYLYGANLSRADLSGAYGRPVTPMPDGWHLNDSELWVRA